MLIKLITEMVVYPCFFSGLHLQSPLASKKVEFDGSGWLMLERGGGGDHDQRGGMAIIEEQSHKRSGCNIESTTSSLPPWLQQYKDEKSQRASNNDQVIIFTL